MAGHMALDHGIGVRIPATQPILRGGSLADSTGWRMPPADEQRRILRRLAATPDRAARALIGHVLVRRIGRQVRASRIVETEAYLAERDPAAHAFRGRTARTEPLWGPPGTIYVYLIYGMHYCLNLAACPEGTPGCVLIRAAEPLDPGVDVRAASGPGRLTRTLQLDRSCTGRRLFEHRSGLWLREGRRAKRIAVTLRIGINNAAEKRLRYLDRDSRAVSQPTR